MDSSGSTLTPIQRDLLRTVFAENPGFFLTGGTALAEYYLHHRRSEDLDLFTIDDMAFATGASLIESAARALGARVEWVRTGPQFRRGVVTRAAETVVVDLVRDIDQQIVAAKPLRENVRVDSLEDMTANKLCALLGRQEVKDVIDQPVLIRMYHLCYILSGDSWEPWISSSRRTRRTGSRGCGSSSMTPGPGRRDSWRWRHDPKRIAAPTHAKRDHPTQAEDPGPAEEEAGQAAARDAGGRTGAHAAHTRRSGASVSGSAARARKQDHARTPPVA